MLEAKGYRLLVKAKEVERVSEGGIIVSIEGSKEDRMEQAGNQWGTVVSIGHTCWKGGVDDTPWCDVGDEIIYAKHAGRYVYDPYDAGDEAQYLIINDDDVQCIVKKAGE